MIIFSIFIIIIVLSFKLKSNKNKILMSIICFLKYCIPLFFITFFGQTFFLLLSVFKCVNGKNYYDKDKPCRQGLYFYIISPLSVLALIIQIIISFCVVSMYYKPYYIVNNNYGALKKRNAISDCVFLLNKIIDYFLFIFDKQIEEEHWIIIIIINFLAGLNAYCNLFIQDFSSILIQKFNVFLSLTLFWSFLILLFQKILQHSQFNGGIYLFFLGILLILLYCLYYTGKNINNLTKCFNNINSSINCLNYIKAYLKIIDEKEISRDSQILFNSFIEKKEEKCTNKKCPLKKYLESMSKGIYSKYLLLQYAEKLFTIAIAKFPQDFTLRINYVIFLYTSINKKKEAKMELLSIEPKFFSFNDNFDLFLCKKFIEEYFQLNNRKNKENIETFNMIQALDFKKYLNEFKNLITKSSNLYYDFWSSLYTSHLQGTEDFKKLNDIGNQLNNLSENIENTFLELNKIRSNDYEIIKLYESFIKHILGDKDKYQKYHKILMNLANYTKNRNKEIDYANFDLEILNKNDENNYLIVSTDEENKQIITNISLNACIILGYSKDKIIGKNINILIPELFQKEHEKEFNKITEKAKIIFYDNLVNKFVYKPEFTEVHVHAKNKSKHLLPLYIKIYLVQTEESELVYIVELKRSNSYFGDIYENYNFNDNENNTNQNVCCILTDNNLKIQTFTSNCVDILKLNSNIINSNYDISSFIKQLNNNYQSNLNDKEFMESEMSEINNEDNFKFYENGSNKNVNSMINKSIEKNLKIKKKLLKRFMYPRKITWRIENNNKASILYSEDIKNNNLLPFYDNDQFEQFFLMQIKEAYIVNKQVGYYFYFQKIHNFYNKHRTLKVNHISNKKQNSLFKSTNLEELLYNNKQDEEGKKRNNPRSSFSHKSSSNIPEYSIEQKRKFVDDNDIHNKFIPESAFNFKLDLNSLSFKPSFEANTLKALNDTLKKQAEYKITVLSKTIKKTCSTISKNSSSNDNSSYNNSSSYYLNSFDMNSSNINSDVNKDEQNQVKNDIGNKSMSNKNNNYFDQYYKANIKNIKYIIYDFYKEKFVEIKDEKKSQMENIMDNYKSNKNIYTNEDDNYPIFANLNYPKEKSNKSAKSEKKEALLRQSLTKTISKFEKEKDFEKEIIDSLKKKDEQKAITQLYITIFLYTFIFIIINSLEAFYIINSYSRLKENMKLIINSINIKYYNNYNIYFLREAILCISGFDNVTYLEYRKYISNKTSQTYCLEVISFCNYTFYQSHSLVESIFSTELPFFKNTSKILYEKHIISETLVNKVEIKKMNSTLSVAIVYLFSFFCNILTDTLEINLNNPEVYNYIHNSMNNLGSAFQILIDIFIVELYQRLSGITNNIIVIIILNFIIYILIYLVNNNSYFKVINKKMSYLTVFYEIKLPLIRSSIKKCELFLNTIKRESMKFEKIEDINEETINSTSVSNTNDKTLNLNNNEEKNVNNFQKEDKNKEKKINLGQKYKKFQLVFIFILSLSFFLLSLILILYVIIIQNNKDIVSYIKHMQNYHNNIIELFNGYREFLFDENTIIAGVPSYEYLIKKEEEIYNKNIEDIYSLKIKRDLFKDIDKELNKIDFCSFNASSLYKGKEQCEIYMGGKEGIISFGFDILINYFIEEIRMRRNYIRKLIDNGILVGNLSDINDLPNWNDSYLGLDQDESLIFRYDIFSYDEINLKLNKIYINIIYQYIDKERNIILNSVEKKINHGQLTYIVLIGCHCFVVLIAILFFWIPKIKNMNTEIFQTKNMLSIIPVEILASLPHIRQLLNISTKIN